MTTVNQQEFIDAGLPEPVAVEIALAIAGQWISDDALPSVDRLKAVGCAQLVAEDIAAGIVNGFLHPATLELQTSWPAAAFERINAVLIELMTAREQRIARLNGRAA